MSPFKPTTLQRRRELEVLQDQLFIMRAQKQLLEAQIRPMDAIPYTRSLLTEYMNLLVRLKVMVSEISRVEEAYREKKDELEASIQQEYQKRFTAERKREHEEGKSKGVVKKLGKMFGGK